jgi:plastocyanin
VTRSTARDTAVVLVAALCLITVSCSDDQPSTATPATTAVAALSPGDATDLRGTASVQVTVADNVYTPRVVRVDPGTTITWTNEGFNDHNVLASEKGQFPDVPTSALEPGMSASRTFDEPGLYPYYCSIHGTPTRGQRGLLVVGDTH